MDSAGSILRVASTNQFSRHLEEHSESIAERTATLGGVAPHANALRTVQRAGALGDNITDLFTQLTRALDKDS